MFYGMRSCDDISQQDNYDMAVEGHVICNCNHTREHLRRLHHNWFFACRMSHFQRICPRKGHVNGVTLLSWHQPNITWDNLFDSCACNYDVIIVIPTFIGIWLHGLRNPSLIPFWALAGWHPVSLSIYRVLSFRDPDDAPGGILSILTPIKPSAGKVREGRDRR